jgi:hypothetical protein
MNIQTLLEQGFRRVPQDGELSIGFTVAYEDTASPIGWDLGVVKKVDRSQERLNYVLSTSSGWLVVNRGRVLQWWPAEAA